jgi:hypothetical protein
VSEGLIDPRHGLVAMRMLREMLRRQPLLYSWGHGGGDRPVLKILRSMGFWIHSTPLCVRIRRPARFLHRNAWLRTSPLRRMGLDFLSATGIGWLGLHALHQGLELRGHGSRDAQAEPIVRFEAWADELWDRNKAAYELVAMRDARTMNALLPEGRWPLGTRLRIRRGAETVGLAFVMDTQMQGDNRFGDLRVGSVVDCFGAPEDATAIIGAALRHLFDRDVDLIVSNQAHPRWVRAFEHCGFVALQGRREFAASPALKAQLEPVAETARGIHLTNLDGHGPMAL